MKKLLTIILIFFSITLYSQNYINWNKADIILTKGMPDEKGILEDLTYICYGKDINKEYYHFDNNICVAYSILDYYSNLEFYVNLLNKDYTKLENDKWIYVTKQYKVLADIGYYPEYFAIIMVKIDNNVEPTKTYL